MNNTSSFENLLFDIADRAVIAWGVAKDGIIAGPIKAVATDFLSESLGIVKTTTQKSYEEDLLRMMIPLNVSIEKQQNHLKRLNVSGTDVGKQVIGLLNEKALSDSYKYGSVFFNAMNSAINSGNYYEAAVIDGANRWHLLWHVTLPGIRTVISTMFVLSFANVLSVSFDQILVMINPSVMRVAETIDYYVYQTGLMQINNYSYATAVSFFKSFISLGLVLITNYGAKLIDEESGLW